MNDGGGVLHWTATTDQPWLLRSSPDSGSLSGSMPVAVSADATGLAVGIYHGYVRVSDPQASNSPQDLPVHLYVLHKPNPADSDYVSITTAVAPTNQPSATSVDVYMGTPRTLESVVIPLTFGDRPYLRVDRSIGINGITWRELGNDPAWTIKVFNVDSVQQTMVIALIRINNKFLPAEGRVATIHFAVDSTANPDTILLDTTFVPPTSHLSFQDSTFAPITPAFQPGAVILEPFRDSLCLSPATIYLDATQGDAMPPCARALGVNCGGISIWGSTVTNPCETWLAVDSHTQGDSLLLDICALSTEDTGLFVCTLTVAAERMLNAPLMLPVEYRVHPPAQGPVSFTCDLVATRLWASTLEDAGTLGTEPYATDGYDPGLDLFNRDRPRANSCASPSSIRSGV